uniref:DNA primase n=1 Tax=Salmonella phage vB_STmST19_KE12 TaxID=3161166 RepID=A0AAU8GCU4_9CAUD
MFLRQLAYTQSTPTIKGQFMKYDWKDIEQKMIGNWQAALLSIVNIDRKIFSGKHQPCPHCMGVDRFRWDDHFETKGDGGAICNQCGAGSGINWLMKLSGMTFPEALEALEGFLNMHPREKLEAIRKELPKINYNDDFITEQEVVAIMAKTTRVAMNEWTLINGIGCDINVARGKSGELIAVEMMRADTMKSCNVAFIGIDGDSFRTYFRAGYNKDSTINGKLTRGAISPIGGDNGKFIYLVSDYADSWKCHYFTGAHVWCCWSPENMWEVVRSVSDETKARLRCIVNYKFDELCAAENAGLPVILPDDADTIRMAKRIRRKIYDAGELLSKIEFNAQN